MNHQLSAEGSKTGQQWKLVHICLHHLPKEPTPQTYLYLSPGFQTWSPSDIVPAQVAITWFTDLTTLSQSHIQASLVAGSLNKLRLSHRKKRTCCKCWITKWAPTIYKKGPITPLIGVKYFIRPYIIGVPTPCIMIVRAHDVCWNPLVGVMWIPIEVWFQNP